MQFKYAFKKFDSLIDHRSQRLASYFLEFDFELRFFFEDQLTFLVQYVLLRELTKSYKF